MAYIRPILIEVVMNLPTQLTQCSHCKLIFDETGVEEGVNKEICEEYPQDLHDETVKLSEWVSELLRLYRHRIAIKLVDIKSFLGVYKSIVYRFRTCPAFIVNKKDVIRGWDWQRLEEVLDKHIKESKPQSCEIIAHS